MQLLLRLTVELGREENRSGLQDVSCTSLMGPLQRLTSLHPLKERSGHRTPGRFAAGVYEPVGERGRVGPGDDLDLARVHGQPVQSQAEQADVIGGGVRAFCCCLWLDGQPVSGILGLALALGATALAIEPDELHRELAIETWSAWALAAAGVLLTIAALHTPREGRRTVLDVS
jgi:hypothetical protein